jgi:hypothetical protein
VEDVDNGDGRRGWYDTMCFSIAREPIADLKQSDPNAEPSLIKIAVLIARSNRNLSSFPELLARLPTGMIPYTSVLAMSKTMFRRTRRTGRWHKDILSSVHGPKHWYNLNSATIVYLFTEILPSFKPRCRGNVLGASISPTM